MLRELFQGFIRVHILFHAAEAPVYGLALMTELARHGYRAGPGTLYPTLHRLEQQGFLRRGDQVVNGKVRKYYRITPGGRRILARAQAQLRELVEEVLPDGGSPGLGTRRGPGRTYATMRRGGERRRRRVRMGSRDEVQ